VDVDSSSRRGSAAEGVAGHRLDGELRSCEAKLLSYIRNHWALEFGTREVRLVIEYQNSVPVLIRVTGNVVREEKLR
jgi:hypothetical protein